MTSPSLNQAQLAKRELRAAMRAIRARLSDSERTVQSRQIVERLLALPEVAAAASFFVYVSCRTEVETHELIHELWQHKKIVTVPKIAADGVMEPHRIDRWDQLAPGPFEILTPVGTTPFDGPLAVCIMPGLAFTERGDRLGYGQGHYDRFLSQQPELTAIGLAFDCQIIETIPTDAHDRRMELVVTPSRVVRA